MERKTAIVIGSSMAGLMAARALANHFAEVVVLERDPLIDDEQPRKGVPQAQHVHVLLAGGQVVLEHYFPGIIAEMVSAGVDRMAWSEELYWYQGGVWKTREPCGLSYYPQARTALENRVRAWAQQHPKITIRPGTNVQGLRYDLAQQRVTGVRAIHAAQPLDLPADLVVDTTGRGSRLLQWLDELGYAAPPKESLPVDLVYVSRIYQKTATPRAWKGLACHPLPNLPRGAILLPLDAERWILTLFGYLGEHPSTDPAEMLHFLQTLPVPDIYQVVAQAQPLSEPKKYEYPQQIRQRYDHLARFPAGLLVMGDALCSFDPVFGQGMTVASLEARALDKVLATQTEAQALRQKFFQTCQQIIETPWLITQAEALRYKQMPGARPLFIRVLQWYTAHVFALSAESAAVYRAFLDVMHLLAGPTALFRPAVLSRVLRRALSGQKAG